MSKMQDLIKQYAKTHDEKDFHGIITEIQRADMIYSAFSPVTKSHFLDYVQGMPCAFIFSEKSFCEGFCRHMKESGNTVAVAECSRENRLGMFADYHRSGFEGVLVDNGQTRILIELGDLINIPDFSKMPENERPVINPSLVCSANRFFQCLENNTVSPDKELNLLTDTARAEFLIPVQGQPKDGKVTVPALERNDGKKVVPFFTDINELRKFDAQGRFSIARAKFDQIETFCNGGELVVLNPFTFDFNITSKTCEVIKSVSASAPENDDDRAVIFTPEGVPEKLTQIISEVFDDNGKVVKGVLRGVRQKGKTHLLVAVDCGEADEEETKSIMNDIMENIKGMVDDSMEFVPASSRIGSIAFANAVPFFEKFVVDVSVPPENFESEEV